MSGPLVVAAILAFFLGVAHSILGEILIFRPLARSQKTGPDQTLFKTRQIRALWSTWHLISLFGWAFALILLGMSGALSISGSFVAEVLTGLFFVSALFWAFGTRGRHPAWIVFLIIAGLIAIR